MPKTKKKAEGKEAKATKKSKYLIELRDDNGPVTYKTVVYETTESPSRVLQHAHVVRIIDENYSGDEKDGEEVEIKE